MYRLLKINLTAINLEEQQKYENGRNSKEKREILWLLNKELSLSRPTDISITEFDSTGTLKPNSMKKSLYISKLIMKRVYILENLIIMG